MMSRARRKIGKYEKCVVFRLNDDVSERRVHVCTIVNSNFSILGCLNMDRNQTTAACTECECFIPHIYNNLMMSGSYDCQNNMRPFNIKGPSHHCDVWTQF
jgi:hypothetical protein